MAGPRELPELFREFFEMAKAYLRQETLDPAKALGRLAGFSTLAGLLWTLAAVVLIVAGHRLIIEVFPEGPTHQVWSGLAYLTSGLLWVGCGGFVGWLASR